jgi:SNW domain-containing protein 1
MRKNKIDRDGERDVSEKIALGMHKGSGQLSGEAMYDARLFNQSAGMDSGFGGDDEYNTYSKPLFDRQEASSVYRPKRDDGDIYGDVDTQVSFCLICFSLCFIFSTSYVLIYFYYSM